VGGSLKNSRDAHVSFSLLLLPLFRRLGVEDAQKCIRL
jgi:hypothetical protein